MFLPLAKVISQDKVVGISDVVTNAKIFFLHQDSSFFSASQALNFLKDTGNYEILSSRGFGEEIVFIKLKIRGNFETIRKERIADSLYVKNRVPFSCDYIIACKVNEKKYYRVKGFASNDFILLFPASFRKRDRASFLNQFWVQELDMACLFDALSRRRKASGVPECLQSCSDRDRKFVKLGNSE